MADNEIVGATDDPWHDDLLGYRGIGQTFGNLVTSITGSRVLSIEAGFGRGKTFFRQAWAEELRQQGEVVVEIDAQLSDHSGDPVVTFVGALLDAIPKQDKTVRDRAFEKGKKIAGLAGKAALGFVARSAANDVLEELTETARDQVEGIEVLETAVTEMGTGLSKLAGRLIEAQLAAEQVRQKELPEQLSALRDALTKETGAQRVVILIDELDRCHPDYAIALLEAMKLVFAHDGFVFCLMINADYLEKLAAHRFGATGEGERYLDKFIDIRLRLPDTPQMRAAAARELARDLPLKTPYGDDPAFAVDAAADLAARIVEERDLSMRQIKRVLLKVELALRCYAGHPVDCPLMVFLAFDQALVADARRPLDPGHFLGRANLRPETESRVHGRDQFDDLKFMRGTARGLIQDHGWQILLRLPNERYRLPQNGNNYNDEAKVCIFLARHYLSDHQGMLDAVREFTAGD
ncbi:NTPase [Ruegeria pomeroyi]|uniref:KAP family P-loop NTPase fold protein n=1 Tax=Ruegeria pomeroyi TaxID=89184 RepID=UPI001F394C11|nr:P-loop NTPase fold protein [Ruegeria pomeroyi]MCE8509375.1 NTPase [Ruegeria pomeroyi]